MTLQHEDGALWSVPVSWTDFRPPDPYLQIGRGRARFRVEDLLALAALLAVRRAP